MRSPTTVQQQLLGCFAFLVAEVSLPPQQAKCLPQIVWVRRFSHRFHRITQKLLRGIFSHRLHRSAQIVRARRFSHRFHRSTQIVWVRRFSHRFHRFTQIVWVRRFSHRFHGSAQIVWVRRFSHRFHRFAQIVWVPSRGCTCLKCTNRATLVHLLLCWCTSCSGKRQSRAETSAPPEVSSFCVNPCNLWEALCCCGGKDTSATIFRTLTICVDL